MQLRQLEQREFYPHSDALLAARITSSAKPPLSRKIHSRKVQSLSVLRQLSSRVVGLAAEGLVALVTSTLKDWKKRDPRPQLSAATVEQYLSLLKWHVSQPFEPRQTIV